VAQHGVYRRGNLQVIIILTTISFATTIAPTIMTLSGIVELFIRLSSATLTSLAMASWLLHWNDGRLSP
jgi:hypothetical protein